jgi:O-antigen/teichoic acid export membrane protein
VQFFSNALSVFGTSIILLVVGLASSVVLARFLTVDDFGFYSVALAFAGVVGLLAQLGWGAAAVYRIRRRRADPARVLATGAWVLLASSLIALLLCAPLEDRIVSRFLGGAPSVVFWLALALVPFQIVAVLFSGVARALDRFSLHNGYRLALAVGTLLVLVGILMLRRFGLVEVLVGTLAVQIGATLGMGLLTARVTGLSARPDRAEFVDGTRFGLKSYAQVLAGQLHERVDLFMIAYFLGDPAQLAFYAVAVRVIERLRIIPESLGTALFPKVAGLEEREAAEFTATVSRHSLFWVVCVAVLLGVAAPILLPLLYGERYQSSIPPFQILVVAMTLLTVYHVLSRYFAGVSRQRINVATQVLATAVNVGLNLWLIPRYGILGAAWASLASYGLEAVLVTGAFVRDTGRTLREVLVLRRSDLAAYRDRLAPLLARARRVD